MQVSVENTGTLQRRMTVEVPEEQISSEVQARLQNLSRTARLDGFRPGKVPMKLVQKRFGDRVRAEVLGEVLRKSFFDAVVQEKLRPAGEPSFQPQDTEAGLSYTATFEVYPEIELAPLEQLKVVRSHCEISDADVDAMIETLRRQQRDWVEVDRPAAEGDQVEISYTGTMDGKPFEGGATNGFRLELGSGRFIEGFESGLLESTAGSELTLDLRFPDDYGNEEMAGKPVTFQVQVHKVLEGRLPELDEAFFSRFGVTEGGEDAFRAEVRRNIERERDQAQRNRTKASVLEALLAANPVALPDGLVRQEAQRLAQEMRQNLRARGISNEHVAELNADMFDDQARRRVALGLIMAEVIRANKLKVDPAKLREGVESIAASYEDPAAVVKWYYEDRNRLGELETALLEDEVVAWVVDKAQVEVAEVTFDDLMKPVQTGDDD